MAREDKALLITWTLGQSSVHVLTARERALGNILPGAVGACWSEGGDPRLWQSDCVGLLITAQPRRSTNHLALKGPNTPFPPSSFPDCFPPHPQCAFLKDFSVWSKESGTRHYLEKVISSCVFGNLSFEKKIDQCVCVQDGMDYGNRPREQDAINK